jgi:hypothetical protein
MPHAILDVECRSRKDAVALPRARARKLVRKWASGDGISIQKWKELVDDELSETSLIKIALQYATSGYVGAHCLSCLSNVWGTMPVASADCCANEL